ncbi:hypothetical protein B0H66DRAFT_634196 [Apodospora peruviana]|uniref:Uncharacterized protein n=1 Tax=Apodospora peruviana TaxID=516989 RepID=A0AAE0MFB0_9PEZI|nr:hypothetical protein B0H66DRAFT_634196 [Apodospora peruviana]
MAPITEFYMTTMWTYTPKAVERMIRELNEAGFNNAQFTYEAEYRWFKVICHVDDAPDVREEYGNISSDIENDAFYKDSSKILNPDGTLKSTFDNEWIVYEEDSFTSERVLNALQNYSFPPEFVTLPYIGTWNKLEDELFTLDHLLRPHQFTKLQEEEKVIMSYDLAGKLVYIGSDYKDAIGKARQKLDVLLEIANLPSLRAEHLLYTEDYIEKIPGYEITADVRYMANIDPKLPSATLLDPARVTRVLGAYERIYTEGASIRLCMYNSDRMRHSSFFGPKVEGRAGPRYQLGNRPQFSADLISRRVVRYVQPAPPTPPTCRPEPDKEAQVAKWIEDVPDRLDTNAVDSVQLPHPFDIEKPRAAEHSTAERPVAQLIDDMKSIISTEPVSPEVKGQLSAICDEIKNLITTAASSSKAATSSWQAASQVSVGSSARDYIIAQSVSAVNSEESWKQLIDENRPIPLDMLGKGQAKPVKGPATNTDSLLDVPSSKASEKANRGNIPPITWSMAPLVPEPVHAATASKTSMAPTLTTRDKNHQLIFKRHLEKGSKSFNTMNQQARPRIVVAGSSEDTGLASPQAIISQTSKKPNQVSVNRYLTGDFAKEINSAMFRLLSGCRYKPGRIAVRVDFGRVVLSGMDTSALAFNNVNIVSRGWKKRTLITELNKTFNQRSRIHFTKVLSTYASDIEDMVNMTDDDSGARLWGPTLHRAWIVYSFRCLYKEKGDELPFVVDIIDDKRCNRYRYEIRTIDTNYDSDGIKPIYIHGLLRNWDLRIMMSHNMTTELEEGLGDFCERLLYSLRISKLEMGGNELRFTKLSDDSRISIQEARILTKWFYLSDDSKSKLEITEVEPLKMQILSPIRYQARSWTKEETKEHAERGEFPWWYETSVVSPEAEELFIQNERLGFAEKTEWDIEMLKERGILDSIYGPALKILRKMDQVGGNETNNVSFPVKRPNDPFHLSVPGYHFDESAPSPSQSSGPVRRNQGQASSSGQSVQPRSSRSQVSHSQTKSQVDEFW